MSYRGSHCATKKNSINSLSSCFPSIQLIGNFFSISYKVPIPGILNILRHASLHEASAFSDLEVKTGRITVYPGFCKNNSFEVKSICSKDKTIFSNLTESNN